MLEKITACPCQTGKRYAECCQPFHLKQTFASTAEQLMRSRYSAYTLVNIPYIVETTVPSQQKLLDQTAMKEWAENTKWVGLSVLNHLPSLSRIHSQVEFKAFFDTDEGIQDTTKPLFLFKLMSDGFLWILPYLCLIKNNLVYVAPERSLSTVVEIIFNLN